MIKAVVFDLYGTLIYLSKKTKPFQRLFLDLGLRDSSEFGSARRIALTEDFKDLSELVQRIKLNTNINLRSYKEEVREELKSATLYPETREVLEHFKTLKLDLISNLATPYKQPFFDLGLDKLVDHYVFSCEVGYRKPQKEIFEIMLAELNLPPEEVLMVGDSLKSDYEGPLAIGMQAVHLDRKAGITLEVLYKMGII